MNSENPTPSAVSRRSLLKAAGWAAPAIVLTTAAPAAVASGSSTPAVTESWDIFSDSWRGGEGGTRTNLVPYYNMNFDIVINPGSTMRGATVTMQFDKNDLGDQIHGSVVTNVLGWNTTREEPLTPGSYEVARHIFTAGDNLAAGTSAQLKKLAFAITGVGYIGEDKRLGTITFESPGFPTKVFWLMRENNNNRPTGQVAFLQP